MLPIIHDVCVQTVNLLYDVLVLAKSSVHRFNVMHAFEANNFQSLGVTYYYFKFKVSQVIKSSRSEFIPFPDTLRY